METTISLVVENSRNLEVGLELAGSNTWLGSNEQALVVEARAFRERRTLVEAFVDVAF